MPDMEQINRTPRQENANLIVNLQPAILLVGVDENIVKLDQLELEKNRQSDIPGRLRLNTPFPD